MPRKNFTRGMTKLTKITADEEAGMAFTLHVIAQTDAGQIIFDQRFDVITKKKKTKINVTKIEENEEDEAMDEDDESDEDNESSDEDDASNVKTNHVATNVQAK